MTEIDLWCGPMYGRKTKDLILELRAAEREGLAVLAVKSMLDINRYPEIVVQSLGPDPRWIPAALTSFDGDRYPCMAVKEAAVILELVKKAGGYDRVGIDEGHFMPGLYKVVLELIEFGVGRILIAQLDLDFKRAPFCEIDLFRELATNVYQCRARCERCRGVAIYSQRLINRLPAFSTDPVVLVGSKLEGATETYHAACVNCHIVPNEGDFREPWFPE